MTRKDWNKIEDNIKTGLYKLVRLVEVTDDGKTRTVINNNKITGNGAMDRLAYIKSKVDSLPPGKYNVECRISPTNHTIVDSYPLEIKERNIVLTNGVEDHTKNQEEMNTVDFDDYVRLIKENASLTAMNTMLETEKEFYKKEYFSLRDSGVTKHSGLSDEGEKEKTGFEIAATTLENCMTGLLPVLQEHFSVQREKIDLQKKQLSAGQTKKIKPMGKKKLKSVEEIAQDKADELYELSLEDEDAFNDQLDELEESDPEIYQLVCEILEIEEEEQEEEEEEEETE